MNEMDEYLRQSIAEHYDSGCWDAITGIILENGTPWQLTKFEEDVEYHGSVWRCLIITKNVYFPDDFQEVVYVEDIFSSAFELYPIEGSRYNHR